MPVLAVALAVVGVGVLDAVAVIAATGDGGTVAVDPGILSLLNLGVLGVFTVGWLRGWVKTGADYQAERAERQASEQRERDMQNALRTEVVPAMLRFADQAARVLEIAAARDTRDR